MSDWKASYYKLLERDGAYQSSDCEKGFREGYSFGESDRQELLDLLRESRNLFEKIEETPTYQHLVDLHVAKIDAVLAKETV